MKLKLFVLIAGLGLLSAGGVAAQDKLAVKMNFLYGAAAQAPNLALEIGVGDRSTISVGGGFNAWKLEGEVTDNKKKAHWIVQPEYRYWFCERFNGHFIGGHAFYGMYNFSEQKIPMLLESGSKKNRYEGNAYGIGVSYGYQIILGKRFNLELTAGFGVARMKYDKYGCTMCADQVEKDVNRTYVGPTKLGVTLVWLIK